MISLYTIADLLDNIFPRTEWPVSATSLFFHSLCVRTIYKRTMARIPWSLTISWLSVCCFSHLSLTNLVLARCRTINYVSKITSAHRLNVNMLLNSISLRFRFLMFRFFALLVIACSIDRHMCINACMHLYLRFCNIVRFCIFWSFAKFYGLFALVLRLWGIFCSFCLLFCHTDYS